jgi:hypothetical protein
MEELIWAAFLSHHPTVANNLTVDLAGLKMMAQELADLFGLTLPVSCTGSRPLHPSSELVQRKNAMNA